MSIAFVLSGGASLGSVQVGMLEALYERGIAPDLIVGTSAGALNGAFIAERAPSVDTARELADVWRGLRRGQVFPVHPITGALGILGARGHLVPDSGLRRLVRRQTHADRLEDTRVPLHVIATDVLSGEDVRLSEGPLVDAVMASAAIPGVLPPVDWHGRLLMDGGVANNAPISHALDLGATEVYVLPTGTPCELDAAPRGALAMLVYATGLLVGRRLSHDIAALDGTVRVTVLPPPCPLNVQPTDFAHADALIRRARADARELLDRAAASNRPKEATNGHLGPRSKRPAGKRLDDRPACRRGSRGAVALRAAGEVRAPGTGVAARG
jgi:NTE family protein